MEPHAGGLLKPEPENFHNEEGSRKVAPLGLGKACLFSFEARNLIKDTCRVKIHL